MRLVVQRVSSASVRVKDQVVGSIGMGFLVLVAVKQDDTKKDAEKFADKLTKLRIMADSESRMNKSVIDVKAKILAIPQFTLYADTSKGNRPSFVRAAKPKIAEEIYNHFVDHLGESGIDVETGKFGAYMDIEAKLDGPVTILI